MTRAEKVIAFLHRFCKVPEGALIGQPLRLEKFQQRFIREIYDNPAGTRKAYLSIARKNGKSAIIAGLLLAHIAGPEAKQNSQIISGAMSRDQAALVFALACKMINLSPELQARTRIIPSQKTIIGLSKNVEYKAISAEGKTAHGLSPVLAILDEVGQVRGPHSEFIDAIVTSQGAHEAPLLVAISTQAPNDADLFSIWLDDAKESKDPRIVCHVYSADAGGDILDPTQWAKANPGLGLFRSLDDVKEQAERASRMPSSEPTFRNLILNQRVELVAPFISKGIWIANSGPVDDSVFYEEPVFCGLDLSGKTDLTALVMIAYREKWHTKTICWTPEKGLRERAKTDRAPYDVWADQGFLRTIPGASIDYEVVAVEIAEALEGMNVQAVAFDRWRIDLFLKEISKIGCELPMVEWGQGFKDMAPSIDNLEELLLNENIAHGGHPVLTMCMANARVEKDAAGNRKLNKAKATGRIDAAVALSMAVGVMSRQMQDSGSFDQFLLDPIRG